MDLREEAFDRVVLQVLEAAAVPELWADALHELAQACGATGAISHLVVPEQPAQTTWSKAVAHHRKSYEAEGWNISNGRMERSLGLIARGWRGIITDHDAFSADDLAHDPFHQEWAYPRGYVSYAGDLLASAPGMVLPISIERLRPQEPFTRAEAKRMNRLFAHLRAAGALAIQIANSAAMRLAETLGQLGCAAALLGRDGRVFAMNAHFERLIGDGLHLVAGRPMVPQPDAARALSSMIHRAVSFDGPGDDPLCPVRRCDGRRPLIAQVTPVVGAAGDVFQAASAILMVTDLEEGPKRPAVAVLQQAFGLTPAEARLAARLGEGLTLDEAAHVEGLSRETVRSRIKAVFGKTGTRRQAELVVLLGKLGGS